MAIFANNLPQCARAKDNILNDQGRDLSWIQTGSGIVLHCHRPKASALGGKPWAPLCLMNLSLPGPSSGFLSTWPITTNFYLVTLALFSLLLIINPCFTQRKSSKIHTFFSETKSDAPYLFTKRSWGWTVNTQALESLIAQLVKNSPTMWETWVQSLGWEDPLEKEKATHSSILAERIPWTVYPWGRKESDTTEQLSLSLWNLTNLLSNLASPIYFLGEFEQVDYPW